MHRPPSRSTLHLPAGAVRRLPMPRGGWLSVVRGCVWLTRRGELADHFVQAGQSLRLSAGAELWLSAEPECELQWLPDSATVPGFAAARRLWQRAAAATMAVRRRLRAVPQASTP